MADEYYNNKIVTTDGDVLMDLTQDTAAPETVLEGKTFHLRSGAPATGTYRPSEEIEARLRATVGHSSKNLINLKSLSSVTRNGVAWTVDPVAGTITANGTATAISQYVDVRFTLPEGNYYFSGCPSEGSLSTYDVYAWDYTTNSRPKKWDGSTNAPSDFDGTKKQFQAVNNHELGLACRVEPGVTVNNLVFKPMVWDGSITDNTFEPYQEPTDNLIETKARVYLNSTIGHSSKNLLDVTKYTTPGGTSNIQINEDTGSLSCTGTGVWCAVSYLTHDDISLKPNNIAYILTCINNLATSTGRLAIRRRDTNIIIYSAYLSTTGKKELKFTASSEKFPDGWYISIMATGSTSTTSSIDISNLMLREASISDDTFEPYQEPTDSLIETKVKTYLNSTVGHSSKNLLEVPNGFTSFNGVTYTANKTAGTITASGTATADAQLDFQGSSAKSVNSGIIKNGLIYSCEGTNVNLICAISYYNSSGTYISEQRATASGTIISIPSNANSYKFWVRKRPAAGSATFVFKPMLREASISDDTFEPYVTPTDEAKQDKPVVLYDAGESSVGLHSVTGLSNLTQYSELHITLFSPLHGDNPNEGNMHTIVYPFIFPYNPEKQISLFDCWIMTFKDNTLEFKRVGITVNATNTEVKISGEIDEQTGEHISIPSNHYIYIKRIVGIP